MAQGFGAVDVELPIGGAARPLPPSSVAVDEVLDLPVPATALTGATRVGEVIERWDAQRCVVLHRGRLVLDAGPSPAERRHRCYSVTKSMTGTLAALAVADGRLDRATRVGELVPELARSGFGDATVGDLADMAVALAYDEDYAEIDGAASPDAARHFGDYVVALGKEAPGTPVPPDAPRSLRALLPTIGRGEGPHGRTFAYATPVTDALGWVLERSTGRSWVDLFAENLWLPSGPEHPARLSLDPAGTPSMGAGLAVATRDLARIGLLLAEGAIPRAVLDRVRDGGDPEVFARDEHYAYLRGYTYRDQWWMPGGAGRPLSAWGIYGQFLWVDPDAEVVVACHCRGADPSDPRRDLEQDAMCRAIVAASRGWVG